jgi:7,8-dihydroneopterin aldolase/epimerase/oxygenase
MPSEQVVTLRGMRFHALIGVLPHEREVPQPLEIDLSVWVRTRGDGAGVLDYRRLYDDAATAVTRGHVEYLEDLVQAIGNAVLRYDAAERVRVVVRKPHVPLPGPLQAAEVALELSRD